MIVIEDGKLYYWQVLVYISYLQAFTKAGQDQNPCIRESFAQLRSEETTLGYMCIILREPAVVTASVT